MSSMVMTPSRAPSRVDHGHRVEVVLRHLAGDLFLVLLGRHAEEVGVHDVGEDVAGLGDDQVAQRGEPEEAVVVDRVDGVDGSLASRRAPVRRPGPPPPSCAALLPRTRCSSGGRRSSPATFSMARTSSAASGSTLLEGLEELVAHRVGEDARRGRLARRSPSRWRCGRSTRAPSLDQVLLLVLLEPLEDGRGVLGRQSQDLRRLRPGRARSTRSARSSAWISSSSSRI